MVFKNNDGFTIIEVMITIVILFVGILAMSLMQIGAIKGNSSAFSRSTANSIGLTFLEELKRLPFDSTSLTTGADLDAGKAPAGGTPNPALADHQYTAANLPSLANMFTVDGTQIIDNAGNRFTLFWNVVTSSITVGTDTFTPFGTIRLFMYWNTPAGQNSLNITMVKFNNT
ncbi:MAG: prepilin-type N-terminal cleavage/methylation domain-containing protein [Desulfobacula sp.]|nr:prepilin-type N-terminal cleavage/methylation domain-containing protein [Desulfobacula sp.]